MWLFIYIFKKSLIVIIRHKISKDFQLLTSDKKIVILKAGSLLENYKYTTKNDQIKVDRDIVDSNPDFFLLLDWKVELVNVMKQNKIQTPAVIAKKIIPFLEEIIMSSSGSGSSDLSGEVEALQEEVKERAKKLREKEIELETSQERVLRREKQIELDLEEARTKLDRREREISDLSSNLDLLTQGKERELELKYQKRENSLASEWQDKFDEITRKESLNSQKLIEVEAKESGYLKKMKEIQQKEEAIRELELGIKSKEMNIESLIMDSQKDLDKKQKEMLEKLKNDMKDLSQREKDFDKKMNDLEEREKELLTREENFLERIKQLEGEIFEKQNLLDEKIRQIAQKEEELSQKNIDFLIDQALTQFEKKIPWQYHRKK